MGFNPVDVLTARLAEAGIEGVGWLDLCCGSGRALAQAAVQLREAGLAGRVALVGVDLVDVFAAVPQPTPGLSLVCTSVTTWTPGRAFDLITCVHGLHYVGDKLSVLTRAAGWLTATGQLVADFDLLSHRTAPARP